MKMWPTGWITTHVTLKHNTPFIKSTSRHGILGEIESNLRLARPVGGVMATGVAHRSVHPAEDPILFN